jgi:1,2-diacylglycerol 3-alpha-glucosyltransferase
LRIVLCTEGYFPILNGVVTFVDMLAKECTRQGHQVLIVTSDHTAKKNYIQDGVLRCPARKSEQFLIDLSVPLDYVRYSLVRAFRPDVIHIQAEWGISLFGLQTARLLRIPLVYTLHTEYNKFLTYAVRPAMIPLAAAILARLERYIAKKATIITSPSHKGRNYFRSIGVDVEVEVIQNSVDLDGFDPSLFSREDTLGLRTSLGIKQDEMCVLFVGRMGPEKSVDVLLDYWAATIRPEHKLRLLLIGGGPDDQKLREQSKTLGLDGQVVFCGKIPHADIGFYHAICDAYVTASVSEMHSVAMLEGLGSGLQSCNDWMR